MTENKLFSRYETDRIQILRDDRNCPLLIQHAPAGNRPYIHPVVAPDGKGCLTENQPWHHLWQHGIYTGLHGVNGVDFWTEGISGSGLAHDGKFCPRPLMPPELSGNSASWFVDTEWRTPDAAEALLVERQSWRFEDLGSAYRLDLDWELQALTDIHFAKCDYGGLFIRMPWRPGIGAVALGSEGGSVAVDGKRGRWLAVAMPLPGRDDHAGIAAFDHPSNNMHPVAWRLDGNFGFSPSRCILGDWSLGGGDTMLERYRLFIFCGTVNKEIIEKEWAVFASIS